MRRRGPSGLAEFAHAAAPHRTFFRTLAVCLFIAVIAVLWGFGLIRFDWRDEIRSLIREAAGR